MVHATSEAGVLNNRKVSNLPEGVYDTSEREYRTKEGLLYTLWKRKVVHPPIVPDILSEMS